MSKAKEDSDLPLLRKLHVRHPEWDLETPDQIPSPISRQDDIILAYGYRVRIHLRDCEDIKREETDGLFNFIYPETRQDLQDAHGILEAAGDLVKQEYATRKQDGSARRGVLMTDAGNLPQKKIFHIDLNNNESKAKDAISMALRMADRAEMKSIAIPPIKDYGLSPYLQSEAFQLGILEKMLFEFEAKENPVCWHFIVTSSSGKMSKETVMTEMRRYAGGSGSSQFGRNYYTQ